MRRIAQLIACLAWLCASGGQWDLIQGFAWGRMFVGYARTMPLDEAAALTFDAGRPCTLCEFVADGKTRGDEGEPRAPGEAAAKAKPPLALPPAKVMLLAKVGAERRTSRETAMEGRGREAPPLGPPRAG